MFKKTLIAAILLRLATVAYAQQTPTVEAIEQIVFECFTQHTQHVEQARRAMANGGRSNREVWIRETDSVRLSALAADFHADCIKDTLQERYGNSGKAIFVYYDADIRNGVLDNRKGSVRVGLGDFLSCDQTARTNMYVDTDAVLHKDGVTGAVTNLDPSGVSRETWREYEETTSVYDYLYNGYFGETRKRGFDARGLERE